MSFIPSAGPEHAISNQLLGYIEASRKRIGNHRNIERISTPVICMTFTGLYAGTDSAMHGVWFTGKVIVWITGAMAKGLTCGRRGKFAESITRKELLEHLKKSALFFASFTAHTLSVVVTLTMSAALATQVFVPVALGYRIITVALFTLSGGSLIWLHNPDQIIARYRKHDLIVNKSTWDKVKEFMLQHRKELSFALTAVGATAAAGAIHLHRLPPPAPVQPPP